MLLPMKKWGNFTAIILSGGQGTRMKTSLPKQLLPVGGVPIIKKLVESCFEAGAGEVRVVAGDKLALISEVVKPLGAICFKQQEPLGTADAVQAARVEDLEGLVLILNGDHPLITKEDIESLLNEFYDSGSHFSVVSCVLENPGHYGRIIREEGGNLRSIVEAKESTHETLKVKEVNTGVYFLDANVLKKYLPKICKTKGVKEAYFTDIVSTCVEDGQSVGVIEGGKNIGFGVNTQEELVRAQKIIFESNVRRLMEQGVIFLDPSSTYVEDDVSIGNSSVIYPNCFIKGKTTIGSFCILEPNCFLHNAVVGNHVHVRAGTYMEGATVKKHSSIGPYARLREGTLVGEGCKVGNFVEMKNVDFGKGSKASHLSYLGDSEVGEDVNIGCGVITCNYAVDRKKYKTKIGKGVFVGSDVQFVAPVNIGDRSVIGSGSTVTEDVPDEALCIARAKQTIRERYIKSLKKKKGK